MGNREAILKPSLKAVLKHAHSKRSANYRIIFAALAALIITTGVSSAAPRTEAELIERLKSSNHKTVINALNRLPIEYPESTNAIPAIKEVLVRQESVLYPFTPWNIIPRKAARSLGNYHATLSPEEFRVVREFLWSDDPNTVMDGLKAFRGMNAPEALPEVLPRLRDRNHHVIRDACRTLAVIGSKADIPAIEPLSSHLRSAVRKDARLAIEALQAKP